MDYDMIRLKMEYDVWKELWDFFEAEIIEKIIKESEVENYENQLKLIHEGYSFKITKNLTPKLYILVEEIKSKLEFKEEIDFYITNSPDTNAYAVSKTNEKDKNFIVVNSSLIKDYDEDELKFIIGHEIGHLISGYARLYKIIEFIFPEGKEIPLIFKNKILLWANLSELTADRYGFIASENFNKCISTFFKLSSGLDIKNFDFNYETYLKDIEKTINKFNSKSILTGDVHPINPIRIKSIELFSKSELFKQIKNKIKLKNDKNLEKDTDKLIENLLHISFSDLDKFRKDFIVSAGIIVATLDKDFDDNEVEYIIRILSQFTMFPRKYFDSILKRTDIFKIFTRSLIKIIKKNPIERYDMFEFLVDIALIDRKIKEVEINFLFDVGKKLFNLQRTEIAQIIGKRINRIFLPTIIK